MGLQATRADKFSFGLWTVGWQASDMFGESTRPVLAAVEAVHNLADLGAYGITFHDDDLIPPGSSSTERQRIIDEFKQALDDTGVVLPMVTTNLFADPVFKDGAFTATTGPCAATRCARSCAIWILPPFGAQIYVFWGGREGSEVDFAKDVGAPLDPTGSQLLFRFVAAAYERRSLAIASHWPFEEWGRFLPEHSTAVSLLDRLLHHNNVVATGGESYRMREARTRPGGRPSKR